MSTRIGSLGPWLALALTLSLAAPTAATRDPGAADAGCAQALPLVWIGAGAAPGDVLDEAEREASRIWQAAGIAFDWARSAPGRAIRPGELLLVLRQTLNRTGGRRRTPLGRLIRVSADRPGRLIELALPEVTRSVLPLTMHGRTVRDFPPIVRDRAVGRALGRVVAHEVGHWLFGRDHAADGLMRPSIRRHDLIAADPPPLPVAWPSSARRQLRVHRPCQVPPVVRHPGASS